MRKKNEERRRKKLTTSMTALRIKQLREAGTLIQHERLIKSNIKLTNAQRFAEHTSSKAACCGFVLRSPQSIFMLRRIDVTFKALSVDACLVLASRIAEFRASTEIL